LPVRLARHHVQARAEQAPLLRARQCVIHCRAHPLEPPARVGAVQRVDLLLGKVERSFGERTQLDELIDERVDGAGELAT
jgi:hypothetical protein